MTPSTHHRIGLPALATCLGLLVLIGCGGEEAEDTSRPADPAELTRHLSQGRELLRSYQVGRALAEFRRCLELDPECVEAHFQRARALLHKEGAAAAVVALDEVERLAPGHLGAALVRMRARLPGAEAAAATLRDRYPGLFEIHEVLLDSFAKGDRTALEGFGRLLGSMSATEPLVRKLLAAQALALPAPNEASHAAWLDLFAVSEPLVALRMFYAGRLYQGRTRFPSMPGEDMPLAYSGFTLDVAEQQYEAVLDWVPLDSPEAQLSLYCLGDISLRMGDPERAEKRLRALLRLESVPQAWQDMATFTLGVSLYKAGKMPLVGNVLRPLLRRTGDVRTAWMLHLAGIEEFPLSPEEISDEHRRLLRFQEEAAALGIDKMDGAGPSAWGDVDGDGDLDLFVCGCDTFVALYRNDGARFTDITEEAGLLDVASGFSATLVDPDNDGDPDLYIGRNGWSGAGPNSLYRNDGKGHFVDVTRQVGLECEWSSFVHSWADFDRDGRLDLFVANGISTPAANVLYLQNEDGTFRDATQASGLTLETQRTRTIGFAIGDYNEDGAPDLFVGGYGTRNRLYRNRGNGTFDEVAAEAGVVVQGDNKEGYVSFFCDFDNDGHLDILATKQAAWGGVLLGMAGQSTVEQALAASARLFRNQGDGTFEDVTPATGLGMAHGTMGANVADVDNDGFLDIYLATGGPDMHWLEPNVLYVNEGGRRFTDVTRFTGLGHIGKGHGATFADLDRDGDLDLYAPQGGFECGDLWANAFYRNELGNRNHWLQVDLVGTRSNRMGVGARLILKAGGRTLVREMKAGGGFGSSSAPVVHFGLGSAVQVDSLEVRWPSGATTTLPTFAADQFLRITEGQDAFEPRDRY